MLLVDALYINNGGGKNLLDLLVNTLEEKKIEVMYIFDNRISREYMSKGIRNATYLSPSLLQRHLFYLRNKHRISSVLTFGNIPPSIRLKCPVFTYFHNILFLERNVSLDPAIWLAIRLKSLLIRSLKKNTTKWIVQSMFVMGRLRDAWQVADEDILVMPVYNDEIEAIASRPKKAIEDGRRFIYVSDGHFYKNHARLIEAFRRYNIDYPAGSLVLTVGNNYPLLKEIIRKAVDEGSNIMDKGVVPFAELKKEYAAADICIYPSLYESFGLGLIEAAMRGLLVCAADLPYVFEVIKPNEIFDPYSVESIYEVLCSSHNIKDTRTEIVCKNRIEDLIVAINY